MAETTLVEVLDTAVKVGLGALISGTATYFTTKLRHTKNLEKEMLQRNWDIIEDSIIELDRRWQNYLRHFIAARDVLENNPRQSARKFSSYRKEFNEIKTETSYMISKLKLIGENEGAELFADFSGSIFTFYLMLENEEVKDEELLENHDTLYEMREKLTLILSKAYM